MKKQGVFLTLVLFSFLTISCSKVKFSNTGPTPLPAPSPAPVPSPSPTPVTMNLEQKSIVFSPTVVSESSKYTYFLKNTLTDDMQSLSLATTNPDFSIVYNECSSTLVAGASCQLVVEYAPSVSGKVEAGLTVTEGSDQVAEVKLIGLNSHFLENAETYMTDSEVLNLAQGDQGDTYSSIDFVIPPTETTVNCGDTITSSITIANDLDCPNTTYALRVQGAGVVVNGNGKSITGANTSFGVSVEGTGHIFIGMNIHDMTAGYAISSYNGAGIRVLFSHFNNNLAAFRLSNDAITGSNLIFAGNHVKNTYAGMITSQSGVTLVQPKIINNTFFSGTYGFIISSGTFTYTGQANNTFFKSQYGFHVKDASSVTLSNLDLVPYALTKAQIVVEDSTLVTASNLKLGRTDAPGGLQEEMGLIVRRVDQFDISNITVLNLDVGIYLQAENGIETTGTISNSSFTDTGLGGVGVRSMDGTAFGVLTGTANNFVNVGTDYYIYGGTTTGPGSNF